MKTNVKKYKISRRLGIPVFEKCQTQTFAMREKRKVQKRGRRAPSEFGKQLIEKQKICYVYGINDKWLKRCIRDSHKVQGHLRENFLVDHLERRLDNIVYRLRLAQTRRMARQMVSHGHITINGRKITIPSYVVKDTDEIGIRNASETSSFFIELKEKMDSRPNVPWVAWDENTKKGSVLGEPSLDVDLFNLASVFEYYSR